MATYYGLNRQGAATSGRYTRTPINYAVPIRRVPAAQPLSTITPPAVGTPVSQQKVIGAPGEGEPAPAADISAMSPQEREAFAEYSAQLGYSPLGAVSGIAKKGAMKGLIGLTAGAPLDAALGYASTALGPMTTVPAALRGINKGVPISQAARKVAPEIQRLEETERITGIPMEKEKVAVKAKHYPVPLTTQAYRKFLDVVAPKKVINPTPEAYGYGDSIAEGPALGAPGTVAGDYGHEARMGSTVGDVAGVGTPSSETSRTESKTTGVPGEGDKPVGRDYGNTGGGSGGSSGGGGYGAGIGGEGQSAGYK